MQIEGGEFCDGSLTVKNPISWMSMSVRQLGELAEVLLEMFPPETDPKSEGSQ